MTADHTPGPWTVNPTGAQPIIGMDPGDGGWLLPIVDCVSGYDDAQAQANVALIAAAPGLLATVQGFRGKLATYVNVYPGDKELRHLLQQCDAAVAKATGGRS